MKNLEFKKQELTNCWSCGKKINFEGIDYLVYLTSNKQFFLQLSSIQINESIKSQPIIWLQEGEKGVFIYDNFLNKN